jgi:malate dehydrogenase
VLGSKGIERVIEMDLNAEEKAMLDNSANAVKDVVAVLGY